nr:MAG TPA: Pancreatic hormone peptide [Caudoviricetes sp.]
MKYILTDYDRAELKEALFAALANTRPESPTEFNAYLEQTCRWLDVLNRPFPVGQDE